MSLQEDVNNQVAAINAQLGAAQSVNLPPAATVSFNASKEALDAVVEALGTVSEAVTMAADAIDGLGGDSTALRARITEIASRITAVSEKITAIDDAEIDLSAVAAASGSHLDASAGLVSLLINRDVVINRNDQF